VDKAKNQEFIHIEPSSLFKGDAKVLEPHLNMMGGAVRLSFEGENKYIHTKIEIWENGKVKDSRGLFTTYVLKNSFDGEASISLRDDVHDEKLFDMITAVGDNGFSSSKSFVDKPDAEMSYSTNRLNEDKTVSFGEETAIWALIGDKEGILTNGDIEESAKEADWALVYKIIVDEKEEVK